MVAAHDLHPLVRSRRRGQHLSTPLSRLPIATLFAEPVGPLTVQTLMARLCRRDPDDEQRRQGVAAVADWTLGVSWSEREVIREDGLAAIRWAKRKHRKWDRWPAEVQVLDRARDSLIARLNTELGYSNPDRYTPEFLLDVGRSYHCHIESDILRAFLPYAPSGLRDDRWLKRIIGDDSSYMQLRRLCGLEHTTTDISSLLSETSWNTIAEGGLRMYCDLRHLKFSIHMRSYGSRASHGRAAYWARERMRSLIGYRLGHRTPSQKWAFLDLLADGGTTPWQPHLTLQESDSSSPLYRRR
jgi:hypothetical protein